MTLTINDAMTPTSILSTIQLNIDAAERARDRAFRQQDWTSVEYWCGRVDAFKESHKMLSLYLALNPVDESENDGPETIECRVYGAEFSI